MSDLIDRQAAIDDIWTVSPLAPLDREWVDRWLRQLPPAQLGTNLAEVGTDCISRQAAIEAVNCVMVMKGIRSWKSIVSETVESAKRIMTDNIRDLPPAQPEIVKCKDCKHRDPEDKKCDCGHDIEWQLPRQDDWYCADGERRATT